MSRYLARKEGFIIAPGTWMIYILCIWNLHKHKGVWSVWEASEQSNKSFCPSNAIFIYRHTHMHNPETFGAGERAREIFPQHPRTRKKEFRSKAKRAKQTKMRAAEETLSHSLDIQMTYAKPAPGGGGPRGAAPPTAPASSSEARSRNSSWSLPRGCSADGHCLAR